MDPRKKFLYPNVSSTGARFHRLKGLVCVCVCVERELGLDGPYRFFRSIELEIATMDSTQVKGDERYPGF